MNRKEISHYARFRTNPKLTSVDVSSDEYVLIDCHTDMFWNSIMVDTDNDINKIARPFEIVANDTVQSKCDWPIEQRHLVRADVQWYIDGLGCMAITSWGWFAGHIDSHCQNLNSFRTVLCVHDDRPAANKYIQIWKLLTSSNRQRGLHGCERNSVKQR